MKKTSFFSYIDHVCRADAVGAVMDIYVSRFRLPLSVGAETALTIAVNFSYRIERNSNFDFVMRFLKEVLEDDISCRSIEDLLLVSPRIENPRLLINIVKTYGIWNKLR